MRKSLLRLSNLRSRSIVTAPCKAIQFQRYSTGGDSVDHTITLPPVPNPESQGLSRNPDASFQVLGTPFSLLSVNLSASQPLYTRRGTLVGLTGKLDNVISTLSVLSPLRRLPLAIPFLYQKVTSSSPITALIGTNATSTSLSTINLDGRTDWIIAQRNALLAWSGQALTVKPTANVIAHPAYWGNTFITGRGLVAVVGRGQIYQLNLGEGESYVAHPKHVVAYSTTGESPGPFRFRSTPLNIQIPSVTSIFPDRQFFREIKTTTFWKTSASILYILRTWARRTIWGDRLFLRFQGPTTLLIQSRGTSITETLTTREINDISDSPAGVVGTKFSPETERNSKMINQTSTPPK